jgi:hypothetical protein
LAGHKVRKVNNRVWSRTVTTGSTNCCHWLRYSQMANNGREQCCFPYHDFIACGTINRNRNHVKDPRSSQR